MVCLGTAIFCRDSVTPIAAEEGLSGVLTVQQEGSVGCYGNLLDFSQAELQSLDSEGRGIITQHQIELVYHMKKCHEKSLTGVRMSHDIAI